MAALINSVYTTLARLARFLPWPPFTVSFQRSPLSFVSPAANWLLLRALPIIFIFRPPLFPPTRVHPIAPPPLPPSRLGSETLSLTKARNYSILAKANGRTQIDIQDVTECEELFLDARRSATLLGSEAGKGYLS